MANITEEFDIRGRAGGMGIEGMKVDRVVTGPDFALGALDHLAISVWQSNPRVEHARVSAELIKRLTAKHDRIALLALLGENCPVPSEEVRGVLGQTIASVADRVIAAANVIEGQGFRGAAMRGVLTGMGLLMRNKHPVRVFQNATQAAVFLEKEMGMGMRAASITDAVTQLRIRMDSPP